MITSLTVVNEYNNYISITVGDPSAKYFIKNIDGLGPVKADITTSTYVTRDGSSFQNARATFRNIVMQLGFNPTYSTSNDPYGDLRRDLYSYFSPKSKIIIVFENVNMEPVYIDGWVESFEPTIFSKDPDVTISIICPEPYFSSLTPNISLREGSGSISLTNTGTMESGLIILLDGFYSTTPNFTITKTAPTTEVMSYTGSLYSGGNMLSFYFITDVGNKTALQKVNAAGYIPGTISPLDPFSGTSVLGLIDGWLSVPPGNSEYTFDLDETSYPLPRLYMVFYKKYIGL